jgi:hypothetical protein
MMQNARDEAWQCEIESAANLINTSNQSTTKTAFVECSKAQHTSGKYLANNTSRDEKESFENGLAQGKQ